ncbi:8468_t:CDS:1, partial [Funneliformis geosporum]
PEYFIETLLTTHIADLKNIVLSEEFSIILKKEEKLDLSGFFLLIVDPMKIHSI